jgi:hypothetical protein
VLALDHDGGFDLSHLGFDEERVGISFSVVFDEDGVSFIVSVFADKVSRTFWEETSFS